MGILNLRFGYFAMGGPGTVRDEPDAAYNRQKRDELIAFSAWFSQKRYSFQTFMPEDTLSINHLFEVRSDNTQANTEQLYGISQLSDCRFSVVVGAVLGDLRNPDALHIEENKKVLMELYHKTSEFNIQIFNINDNEVPLTPNILRGKKDDKVAFYLMDNATRSRDSLENWHKRQCNPR